MSHTYFISDLHLSEDRPDIPECLLGFLSGPAKKADALYVLGDLFEYWLGDDDVTPLSLTVSGAFTALANHGVPLYFIHGNRDFLIRNTFADACSMTLLPEQKVIDLYGTPTLIMHGDELCTLDIDYQRFRTKARGWWWPKLVLSLPLFIRKKIAKNGRKKSQMKQKDIAMHITDVTQQDVIKSMKEHGVYRLIHGHTHRPAIHDFELNGHTANRIVLGDWYDQGSMLRVDPQDLDLQSVGLVNKK
jgi:UDP-2,3-diacylglucosamine hydrolase